MKFIVPLKMVIDNKFESKIRVIYKMVLGDLRLFLYCFE